MAGKYQKRKRVGIFAILIVTFSLVAVIFGAIIISYISKRNDESQTITVLSETLEADATLPQPTIPKTPLPTVEPTETPDPTPLILPQYARLYEENEDIFGWISIEDTVLDYPVMHTPDEPERYLRTAFDGSSAKSGVPFMEADCSADCGNYIIFGHNMKDGTMFTSILKYADKAYWEQHPIIHFSTLYEQSEYEVVAAFYSRVFYQDETDVFRFYDCVDLSDRTVFCGFEENLQEAALYDTGIECEYGDSFITLITCAYHTENGRFVVVARKMADR
jgi:sortase B